MSIQHDIIQRSNVVEGHIRQYLKKSEYDFTQYSFGVSYGFRGRLSARKWWDVMMRRGRLHIFCSISLSSPCL